MNQIRLAAAVATLVFATTATAQQAPAPPAPAPPAATPPAAAPPSVTPPPAAPPPEAVPAPAEPVAPAAEPPPPAPGTASPAPAAAAPEAAPVIEAPPVEEETAAGAPAGEEKEIVVTGSRVKRTVFQTSAPVEIIDRKQLEYSGATNLADVIQNLTVSQGTGFQGNANASGTVSIDLRGLGSGMTLVLLNGRRLVTSAGGIAFNFTDIGTIPLAAVERIEILKGGASAIYGTDAVGGVVNIITRKDWNGARVQLEGQASEEFDYKDGTGSVAFGAASERSRVSLAVAYNRRYQLKLNDRDFTAGPPSDWKGYRDNSELKDALHTQNISVLGNPSSFGVMLPGSPLAIPAADPACGAKGTGTTPDTMAVPGATLCAWDYRDFSPLVTNLERVSTYGWGEYDLTRHTSVFTELNVSRMRDDGITSPSYSLPSFPAVRGDHVDNPNPGSDLAFYGRPLGSEAGGAVTQAGDDTLRSVVGLKGDLRAAAEDTVLEDWEWELFASYGVSRYYNLFPDNIVSRFEDAVSSCADPADLGNCFNPWYSAVDGSGTPNADSVVDGFTGTLTNISDQWLQTYNAGINGSLAELPGGDLGFAIGGEIRHEARASELDHDSNQFDLGFFLGNSDATADRDVGAGYAELVLPFYDGVEVQLAGRLEHYSDIGAVGNPTAGLLLTPAEIAGSETVSDALRRLTFRGRVASASTAPTLYQVFPGCATVPTQITYMGIPNFVPVYFCGNDRLRYQTAITASGGFSWNPVRPLSFEADYWNYHFKHAIVPESPLEVLATGRSAVEGFDPPLVPIEAEGQLLQRLNLTTVNSREPVLTDGVDFGAMLKFDKEELGADVGTFRVGATGTYTLRFRVGQGQVPPLDVADTAAGAYQEPPHCDAGGGLTMADLGTRTERLAGKHCDLVGEINGANSAAPLPVLRANFPVAWEYEGHLVAFITHFTSGLEDDVRFDPDTGKYNSIDPWTTFDLQYGYTIDDWFGESLSLRAGVYNLADADPPFVDQASGFSNLVHDPRGRMFFTKVIGEF